MSPALPQPLGSELPSSSSASTRSLLLKSEDLVVNLFLCSIGWLTPGPDMSVYYAPLYFVYETSFDGLLCR
jgi:hypothetical protein